MEAITSLRKFYGGFATGILMDWVMGCRYGGFIQVFCGLHGFANPPRPLPTQPSCENQAMLMLLTERNIRKAYVIAT